MGNPNKAPNDLGHEVVCKAFVKAGWTLVQGGSHCVLKKEGFPNLTIPRHNPVKSFLLKAQIVQAGMTVNEFKKLL